MSISSEKITSNYNILHLIGKGGMGDVYLAEHKLLHRKVAIKALKKELCENEQFKARFKNEALVMAKLQHPGIVALYEYVEDEEGVFLIMEYAEGIALDDFIAMHEGKIKEDVAQRIMLKALEAMQYAHDEGIIHRDIKPANIIYNPEKKSVKILDFGIAKLSQEAQKELTKTGTQVGTIYYMSPEQIKGEKVDARTDIYSLGVVYYQLIKGENPYKKFSSEYLISDAIVKDVLPELDTLKTDDKELILKLTQKERSHRFQSCNAVLQYLNKPVAEPLGIEKAITNTKKKNKIRPVAVAIILLVLLTFGGIKLLDFLKTDKELLLTDIDGNKYGTVQIGEQVWMAENLNVSQFRNGDLIPQAKTAEEWIKAGKEGKPAWCWVNKGAKSSNLKTFLVNQKVVDVETQDEKDFLFHNPNAIEARSFEVDNDTYDIPLDEVESFLKEVENAKPLGLRQMDLPENQKNNYGKLYNWYAVSDERGLAPEGWEIPTENDWLKLAENSGGINIAGSNLKSYTDWEKAKKSLAQAALEAQDDVTHFRKFNALPGGGRGAEKGVFDGFGKYGNYWIRFDENNNLIKVKNKKKISELYIEVSKDYEIGTLDEFSDKLKIKSKRFTFHKEVGEEYSLGTFENFEKEYGLNNTLDNAALIKSKMKYAAFYFNKSELLFHEALKGQGLSVRCLKKNKDFQQKKAETIKEKNNSTSIEDDSPKIVEDWEEEVTDEPTLVEDFEGNRYKTVKIGGQLWMAENLNTSHYRDGTPIPEIIFDHKWIVSLSGAWCYYDNDVFNKVKFGKLYNWYAVNDERCLCPKGWRIPNENDWIELERYIGSIYKQKKNSKFNREQINAAEFIKSKHYWNKQISEFRNQTGFSALPSGARWQGLGSFSGLNFVAAFWTSTKFGKYAKMRYVNSQENIIHSDNFAPHNGFSVRCIKD